MTVMTCGKSPLQFVWSNFKTIVLRIKKVQGCFPVKGSGGNDGAVEAHVWC